MADLMLQKVTTMCRHEIRIEAAARCHYFDVTLIFAEVRFALFSFSFLSK